MSGYFTRIGSSVLVAVWLSSACAEVPKKNMEFDGEPDTPAMVAGDDEDLKTFLEHAEPISSDLPQSPEISLEDCDENLPEDLLNQMAGARMGRGDNFDWFANKSREQGEAIDNDQSIQSRIQAYKAERREFFHELFSCEDNEELHKRARILQANPTSRTAFENLYVGYVEERGDEVLELFEVDDFKALADVYLDQALADLRRRFKDVDDYIQEDTLRGRIHESIEKNHESLALMALRGELIDIFQMQISVPNVQKTLMQRSIQSLVVLEALSHIRGNINGNLLPNAAQAKGLQI